MNDNDLNWLAGLLEGEGNFCWAGGTKRSKFPAIDLKMTDRDVVNRAATLLGRACMGPYGPYGTLGAKPVFQCRIAGQPAIEVMCVLKPLMGERRQARIQEIVDTWSSVPRPPRGRPRVHHPMTPLA
jgi:hypothetical protein